MIGNGPNCSLKQPVTFFASDKFAYIWIFAVLMLQQPWVDMGTWLMMPLRQIPTAK
jgi:hypothetical protein